MSVAQGNAKIIFNDNTSLSLAVIKHDFSATLSDAQASTIKQLTVGPNTQVIFTNPNKTQSFPVMPANSQTTFGPLSFNTTTKVSVLDIGSGQRGNVQTKEHFGTTSSYISSYNLFIVVLIILAILLIYKLFYKKDIPHLFH